MLKFSEEQARQIVESAEIINKARISDAQTDAPVFSTKITIPLDVARSVGDMFPIGFPFKGVFVESATDTSVKVDLRAYNNDDKENSVIPLGLNDVYNHDFSISRAYLTWEAQPNKSVTLIFINQGKFESGSRRIEVSSAVEGNSISVLSPVTLSTSATKLVDQNLNRTVLNWNASAPFEIASSSSASIWFPVAQIDRLKNTAEVWARSISGSSVVKMLEES